MRICVFDAYGTLFDVASAARRASEAKGGEALAELWPTLSADWRAKQLQYTWLRAITGDHTDFWQVTQDGLDWAMEKARLDDPVMRETLLALYWELEAYPEVPAMLSELKQAGHSTAILSNGSPDMLGGAVDFAGIGGSLDTVLSVEEVGVFKPAAKVYDMVNARLGGAPADVLFVSSNGWDTASAASYGFETAWVNRADEPVDRLPGQPHHVMTDLSGIAALVAAPRS